MENPTNDNDPAQLKKQKKLEKLRIKREAAQEWHRTTLRDQFMREQNFSLATVGKSFAAWEGSCQSVKGRQLQEELQQLLQYLETQIDRRTNDDQRMQAERKEFEELFDKHLLHLKEIILYYENLRDFFVHRLLDEYEQDTEHVLHEFDEELRKIQLRNNLKIDLLENTIVRMEKDIRNDYEVSWDDFLANNEDVMNEQIEQYELLRDSNYSNMTQLYHDLQHSLEEFLRDEAAPKEHPTPEQLVEDSETSCVSLAARKDKINELHAMVEHLERAYDYAEARDRKRLTYGRLARYPWIEPTASDATNDRQPLEFLLDRIHQRQVIGRLPNALRDRLRGEIDALEKVFRDYCRLYRISDREALERLAGKKKSVEIN